MSDHFNGLTPDEAERLALLLEELGEAQQVIGKILRHGYVSYHPNDPAGPNNHKLLTRELGDVQAAIEIMVANHDLSSGDLAVARDDKMRRVVKYLHYRHNIPQPTAAQGETNG